MLPALMESLKTDQHSSGEPEMIDKYTNVLLDVIAEMQGYPSAERPNAGEKKLINMIPTFIWNKQ